MFARVNGVFLRVAQDPKFDRQAGDLQSARNSIVARREQFGRGHFVDAIVHRNAECKRRVARHKPRAQSQPAASGERKTRDECERSN